jgi:DNA-binding CsgD family transcriptional regulator
MASRHIFALVGLNTIQYIAMRSIISEHGLGTTTYASSLKNQMPGFDRADVFVVSSYEFMMHLDYYLPRKTQTIVLLESNQSLYPSEEAINCIFNNDAEDKISELLKNVSKSGDDSNVSGNLSIREIDVLKEIAKGKTNKEIADTLCISVNTVITHRRNLTAKIGIRSASGLSLYAMMNGLI